MKHILLAISLACALCACASPKDKPERPSVAPLRESADRTDNLLDELEKALKENSHEKK